MKKDKLIVKQALKIAEYKAIGKANDRKIKSLKGHFTAIGQPLNDNILKFNPKQLQWAQAVLNIINELR